MRTLIALALLFSTQLMADEDYSTAVIVDAGRGTELRASLSSGGGVTNTNVNVITVEIDGMRYSAEWQTLTPGGKNAASQFVVGSEVQVRVHNDKALWILREDGKPLKVQITRREIVD